MSSPDRSDETTPPPPETTTSDDDDETPRPQRQPHQHQHRVAAGGGGPLAGVKLVFFSAFRLDEQREKHKANVVQCLDLDERVWLPPKTLPFDVHAGAALCQQGKHICLVGGVSGSSTGTGTATTGTGTTGTVTSQFLKYELQQNAVLQCHTQGLQARTRSASFAAADGRIYVLGGTGPAGGTAASTKKPLNSVQCYENATWKTLGPLLYAMATPTASVFDGKCYLVGVSDAPTASVRLQVNAFLSDETWTEVCLPVTIPPRLQSVTALIDRDGTLQVRYFLPVARPGFYQQASATYDAAGRTWTSRTDAEADGCERLVCVSFEEGCGSNNGRGGGTSRRNRFGGYGCVGPLAFAEFGRLPRSATFRSTGAVVHVDIKSSGGAVYGLPYYEDQCPSLYTVGLQC